MRIPLFVIIRAYYIRFADALKLAPLLETV